MTRGLLIIIGMWLWLAGIGHASIVFMDGFENGGTDGWTVGGGTFTASTTQVHGGAYSGSTSTINTFLQNTLAGQTTLYVRFYLYTIGLSNSILTQQAGLFAETGTSNVATVYLVTDGSGNPSLQLVNRASGPTQIGSNVAITAGAWHLVEVKTVISASAGILEMKVDGVVGPSGSSLNTGTAAITRAAPEFYNDAGTGSPAGTVYFDDVIESTSGYIGPGSIITRQCNIATPTFNNWSFSTGSNIYNVWDDTPVDNHWAFNSQNAQTQTCGLSFGNTTDTGAMLHGSGIITSASTINGAEVMWLGKSTTNGDTAQDSSIWFPNGGSETDTAGPNAYPGNQTSIWEQTIVATPTAAQVLNLQTGIKHAANTFQHQVFGVWTMVDYTGAGSGAKGQGVFMP